jgi:hypothetical protein
MFEVVLHGDGERLKRFVTQQFDKVFVIVAAAATLPWRAPRGDNQR